MTESVGESKSPLTEILRAAVEHSAFEDKYGKGFFRRETHSKAGEHIILVYNDHRSSEQYIPPLFYVQVYPPGRSKPGRKTEEYMWTAVQDPEELYPGSVEKIKNFIGVFEPVPGGEDGEA